MCKQGVQALFEQCQASMDPNSIAQLLAHHPYHIDALLAMFELYRCAPLSHTWAPTAMPFESHQWSKHDRVPSCVFDILVPQISSWDSCRATGQHEQADELLERCLYALEMALHPYCVLGDANCRIPYESEREPAAVHRALQAHAGLFTRFCVGNS